MDLPPIKQPPSPQVIASLNLSRYMRRKFASTASYSPSAVKKPQVETTMWLMCESSQREGCVGLPSSSRVMSGQLLINCLSI